MKTYKNISPLEQLGIEPGKTGEADIPKEQEIRMIARGSIELVGEAPEEPTTDEPGGDQPPAEVEKTPEQIQAEEKATADAQKAADDAKAREAERGGRGGRGR